MTNAAQGNPMIPSHPSIQAAHAQASTGGPNPQSNGSTPPAPQAAPAQQGQSFEMDWANLALSMGDEDGNPQPQAPAPNAQSAPGQQAPAGAQSELSPEQKEAIARANMEAQPQPPANAQAPANVNPQEAVEAAVKHLLNTQYKLTDEQKQQLVSQPDEAIPQLAARMHVQIATTLASYMQQAMQQIVPQMALSAMNKQMGAFKAEQTFFGQYPALNKQEFRPVVLQSLKLAKAYNPNATREQVMKEAAELAAFKLKVNLAPTAQQAPAAPRQPHNPSSMPQAAPMAMPFMPAPPGGAPAATAQNGQQSDNIFADLANDPNW